MARTPAYPNGEPIEVGDFVLFERGKTPGTVVVVVEGPAQFAEWNVEKSGVMVRSAPFGLVYLPAETLADDPILFVSRGVRP